MKLANSEKLLTIPKEVLFKGASVLPGESLADYYRRTGASLEEEYKKWLNEK